MRSGAGTRASALRLPVSSGREALAAAAGLSLQCLMLSCLTVLAFAEEARFLATREDPRLVSEGEFVLHPGSTPPGDSALWQPVSLSDMWDESRPDTTADRGWYRFAVEPPSGAARQPLGVYLWRYSMNARIFFNDELIADGGSFENPAARNIHRPLLGKVPASAWRADDNYVYVHLRVYPGYGYLLPIAIGPYGEVLPAYRERYFYQITLSQYLFVVTLLVAVLGGCLWLVDQRRSAYAYFTGASLCWLVYCLNPFIRDLPFSMKTWLWLLHSSIEGFAVMLLMFVHRITGHRAPLLERAVWVFLAAMSIHYALLPIELIGRHSTYAHLVSMLIIVYLTVFCLVKYVRTRRTDALLFLLAAAVIAALAAHDLMMISGMNDDLWRQHFLAVHLATPLMFLVMVGYLMWRLHANNVLLREQIAEATVDLERSFRQRETLERRRAAADERERIYRDLHDDIGARLLSMVYRAQTDEQANLAREALRDLRTIVAQSGSRRGTLEEAAAAWHLECSNRAREAGCALDWNVEASAADLNPKVAYHLTRVLRELVSNATRHGRCRRISVDIVRLGDGLELRFDDDGGGFDSRGAHPGSGMAGIRKRLGELGGEATWSSDGAGTVVRVCIPRIGGWLDIRN